MLTVLETFDVKSRIYTECTGIHVHIQGVSKLYVSKLQDMAPCFKISKKVPININPEILSFPYVSYFYYYFLFKKYYIL